MKIQKIGGGEWGSVRVGCKRRSEVFVKIKKNRRRGRVGGRVDVNEEVKLM